VYIIFLTELENTQEIYDDKQRQLNTLNYQKACFWLSKIVTRGTPEISFFFKSELIAGPIYYGR